MDTRRLKNGPEIVFLLGLIGFLVWLYWMLSSHPAPNPFVTYTILLIFVWLMIISAVEIVYSFRARRTAAQKPR